MADWHFACHCRHGLPPDARRAYRAVVDHLRHAGPATTADLRDRLGLTDPHIGELVGWAVADGLAVEGAGQYVYYVRP